LILEKNVDSSKNTSLGLAFFSKQEVSEVFFSKLQCLADLENRFHGQFHMWKTVWDWMLPKYAEIHSGKHQQKVAFHTWLLMALHKSVHTHLSRYHEKNAPHEKPLAKSCD